MLPAVLEASVQLVLDGQLGHHRLTKDRSTSRANDHQ